MKKCPAPDYICICNLPPASRNLIVHDQRILSTTSGFQTQWYALLEYPPTYDLVLSILYLAIPLRRSSSNMTDSGGFIKVPTIEEEERMRKAAEEAQRKREEARKKVEMEEAMKKAGEESRNRRRGGGEGGSGTAA